MKHNPDLDDITFGDYVGFDIETSGLNRQKDCIHAFAVSDGDTTWCVDMARYDKDLIRDFFNRLKESTVISHYTKFDAGMVHAKFGILFKKLWCTSIASRVLTNGKKREHKLPIVLERYLGIKDIDAQYKKRMQQRFIEHKEGAICSVGMLDYVGGDTKHLLKLQRRMGDLINDFGDTTVINLENALTPVIIKMENRGTKVDTDLLLQKSLLWEAKRMKAEKALDHELKRLSGSFKALSSTFYTGNRVYKKFKQTDLFVDTDFMTISSDMINYGAQAQVLTIFSLMGQPLPRADVTKAEREKGISKGSPSTEEDVLNVYLLENPKSPLADFVKKLLSYRRYSKLSGTYGKPLLDKVDADGFIHAEFGQVDVVTGRLNCSNPNLQNQPADKEANIREVFVADEGNSLVVCDMDGAEIAIAASYSKDPVLLKALKGGADMHSELASASYSLIFDQKVKVNSSNDVISIKGNNFVLNDLRQDHKPVVFSKFYMAGAKRVYKILAKYINKMVSGRERYRIARRISRVMDKKLVGLNTYLKEKIAIANETGFLIGSVLGRRRYFVKKAYGEAANFPIQNTNAEAIKIALVNMDRYLEKVGYGFINLTVHDELVVEFPDEVVEKEAEEVKDIIEKSLAYFLDGVESKASYKISKHWIK
jgi:DNA polymerase I-like protein with 3'-5' exonuclease and polymerase domains